MTRIKTVVSRFWNSIKLRKMSDYNKDTKIKQIEPGESVVEMQGITKRFPGVLANDILILS